MELVWSIERAELEIYNKAWITLLHSRSLVLSTHITHVPRRLERTTHRFNRFRARTKGVTTSLVDVENWLVKYLQPVVPKLQTPVIVYQVERSFGVVWVLLLNSSQPTHRLDGFSATNAITLPESHPTHDLSRPLHVRNHQSTSGIYCNKVHPGASSVFTFTLRQDYGNEPISIRSHPRIAGVATPLYPVYPTFSLPRTR
ncbi:hypothetical protein BDQ17DRAFT_369607 [Cyathus striatus]|nr:hypothetical protein BDQ17DRAFT_369607 [Cyathus striatus]